MVYITNCHTNDGFGSQFQVIVCLILICIKQGYQFIYNPLCFLEHNYDNDPDFIKKIEELMNISSKFPTIDSNTQIQDLQIHICDVTVKYVVDANIEDHATESSLQIVRDMFWQNKDRSKIFQGDTSHTHVAIHIRRPNMHDVNSFKDKPPNNDYFQRVGTPNEYYLDIMQIIRKSHILTKKQKPLMFHIYSQGEPSLFKVFHSEDTMLHINTDVFSSFTEMVAADILVTSFSSFSYIAAFLNSGTIYYCPFWHPPRKNWINIPIFT